MSNSGESKVWPIIIIVSLAVILLVFGLLKFLANDDKDAAFNEGDTKQVLLIPEIVEQAADLEQEEESDNFASDPLYQETLNETEDLLPEVEGAILPELKNSDAEFRQDVLAISDSAQLKQGLFKEQIISKTIASINDMAQGMRPPAKVLRELKLSKPFLVITRGDKMYISPKSYQRYDPLAHAVNRIDSQAAVALYKKYLPLFEVVFKEFSYPKSYQVLDIFKAAVGKILQAPIITGRIEVIQPSVHYKFADSKLEKLSALDKQMLRMGPDNTRLIQKKMRELVQVLIASEQE
ncbi:DUF3014 domain-containing protein [methanotrophic endosymbiont of Bathymodiolus puteoserpentis (Logatchev)]|jgi:hypothetical protein|uniref:DUF3014 domain-containing protein n=1 Tax=methanotrophic endosymbiont of Bathymodiolus puteoserpentis (Logatchev) TaxID=343235 RepID=UPI0013CB7F60|nr:DUF3014 domain-containing protein [methanotrophic endosymbiont of Bathymodiolus puteoserpentis (Logatchev)]SHE22256.1 hypothetical protein BPUTEOMOX_2465 [methanotrophic endosymbiont of Bathymodiolus puteoserpentis (Logatchev)]